MKREHYISLGSIIAILGLFSWFTDKIEVKADRDDVKAVEEEVDQEENINVQQQQQINFNTLLIEKLDKKFDKELAE